MTDLGELHGVIDPPLPSEHGYGAGIGAVAWSIRCIEPIIRSWTDCPHELKDALNFLKAAPPPSRPDPGTWPQRGGITEHPLYSALWAQPTDGTAELGRVAQAAVLMAACSLSQETSDLHAYKTPLRTACRAVRRILLGKLSPPQLETITTAKSMGSLVEGLTVTLSSTLEVDERRLVLGLRAYLLDAIEARAPRHHARHERAGRQARHRANGDDDPIRVYDQVEDSPRGYSQSGVDDAAAGVPESPGRRLVITPDDTVDVAETHLSAAQMWYRAHNRSRAIAATGQGLMLGSDRLQLVDIAAIHRCAKDLLTNRSKLSKPARGAAAIVCLSLLSGRTLEQAQEFRVVATVEELPSVIVQPFLVTTSRILVLPVPPLRNAFTPNESEVRLYRSTRDHLWVRLPELPISDVVLQAVERIGRQVPFRRTCWKDDAARFCNEVNKRMGSRTTVARVAQFLARQVYVMTHDWADAALISGMDTDADARLYYYAPALDDLQKCYNGVWAGAIKALGVAHSKDVQDDKPELITGAAYVGSRACPTDAVVKSMVQGLGQQCSAALTGRRDGPRAHTAHNAIALYTCMLVMWHTGVRAVDEPIDLALYDPDSGYLGISDKDNDAYYASRVACLPKLARLQIGKYFDHLDTLSDSLEVGPQWKRRLFFFDSKDVPVPLTLQRIASALVDYPFRLNAQRHYLRTRLRELEVPAQSVDALLGHGAPGQESYSHHSCLSAQQMGSDTAGALDQLSREAGWRLLPKY